VARAARRPLTTEVVVAASSVLPFSLRSP